MARKKLLLKRSAFRYCPENPGKVKNENIFFFFFFSVNTKNISSHVLKKSSISLVKMLIFSTHSMEYIWYSPQKSKYPLFISNCKQKVLIGIIKQLLPLCEGNMTICSPSTGNIAFGQSQPEGNITCRG